MAAGRDVAPFVCFRGASAARALEHPACNVPGVAVLRNKRVRSYLLWALVIAVGVANAAGVWVTRLLTGLANIFLLLVVIAYAAAWLVERRQGRKQAADHDAPRR